MAATTRLVQATSDWALGHPLALRIPQATQTPSLNEIMQHFSASPLTSYEILLLSPSAITICHCHHINPAFLYPPMGRLGLVSLTPDHYPVLG